MESKGVICQIVDPEQMPVDSTGTRADIVMDAGSTISRMNLGRLYEQYFGSASYDVTRIIRNYFKIEEKTQKLIIKALKAFSIEQIAEMYNYLLGFYKIISTKQFEFFSNVSPDDKIEHLADIIKDGVYVYYPIDNEKECESIVKEIEKYYKPVYGPVTYIGNSGIRTTTEHPVRIGPLYMMLLEKITDDWSAVASGKLQHFGILSPQTKSEKYAYPYRNTPVRTIGETEGRIFAGYCNREAVAEMMDRSNNPSTHRQMVWNILTADQPTNIESVIDRELIPLGSSKPLQLVRHIAMSSGWLPVYEPPEPSK